MGRYISIHKVAEDSRSAQYRFQGDQGDARIVEINKENGEVSLITPMPSDTRNASFLAVRWKVSKLWRSGNLPDVTQFAS